MSILDFPRLNFRGIFTTNPCTANNDDVMPSVVTRDTNSLGQNVAGMSDDQAIQYLNSAVEMRNYADPTGVKTFIRTGWNPLGDHTTTWDDTTVTSAVTGAGAGGRKPDPIVGVGIELLGAMKPDGTVSTPMICDLDPTGLVSTQLFVGGVRFFEDGPKGRKVLAEIFHDTCAYQDWLNFNATVAPPDRPYAGEQNFVGIACVWQFVIPKEKLPAYTAFGIKSPALKALLDAAQAAGGLALRFKTYEVEPGYTDGYLAKATAQGNAVANPAYGYLIGTIGVWGADEPHSEPAGRKLEAPYRAASPTLYIAKDDPDQGRPAMQYAGAPDATAVTVPGCPYPWMGAPALIGNAVALVRQDPPVISLDILESFPKFGFRNPDGPTANDPPQGFERPKRKAYVGEVELAVVPAGGGDPVSIAPIPYGYEDYSAYEDFGGIVDLAYDPETVSHDTIANGTLVMRGTKGSALNGEVTLLTEAVIRVVTDDRTAYMTTSDPASTLSVQVSERGGPTTRPVTLWLNEYKTIIQLKPQVGDSCTAPSNEYRTNQSVDSRTAALTVTDPDENPPQCPPAGPAPARLDFPASVTIPAGTTGWFPIPVRPNTGGTAVLALQQDDDAVYGTLPPATPGGQARLGVAGVPMWSTKTYCSARVFEAEDFSGLYAKDGTLQWEDVYNYALRYYYLLFPAMSTYIPLNYASSITSPYAAELIKQRLGTPKDAVFHTTLNMPVTRTLSPARANLILDFVKQAQDKLGGSS